MNTKNNQRFQGSERKIRDALMNLLKTENPQDITIQNICDAAQVNRTTFYAHFSDICDLTEKCEIELRVSLKEAANQDQQLVFLRLMRENQHFYRLYFLYHKTHHVQDGPSHVWLQSIDSGELASSDRYRLVFYRAGIEALLTQWVEQGCMDSPEEIHALLMQRLPVKLF